MASGAQELYQNRIYIPSTMMPLNDQKTLRRFRKYLKYNHKLPFHLPFSFEVFDDFVDRSSFELFELLRDLATDNNRSISTKIGLELRKCPLDTVY